MSSFPTPFSVDLPGPWLVYLCYSPLGKVDGPCVGRLFAQDREHAIEQAVLAGLGAAAELDVRPDVFRPEDFFQAANVHPSEWIASP